MQIVLVSIKSQIIRSHQFSMSFASRLINLKQLLTLVLLALAGLVIACTPPSASEQDKNWSDASDLIETSDRVIVAQFVDAKLENIQLVDSVTGSIDGDVDVLFRQFEVFETLKGTSDRGDLLWVAFEPGRAGELVNAEGEVRDFDESATYVLFLKGRLRPLEYPTEFGSVLWTGNGEPSVAELIGDELEFRAVRSYLNLISGEDRTVPDSRSASPFTLTLAQARDLAN